MEEAAASFNC